MVEPNVPGAEPTAGVQTAPVAVRERGGASHGSMLLTAIVAIILAVAFFQLWQDRVSGSVLLVVRSSDGARTVESLALNTGTRTPLTDASLEGINSRSVRTITLPDATVITIEKAGVVRKDPSDPERVSLLIASAVPTTALTPLSVWGDAERIAWVSPADQSIQVFEQNERGVYVPLFVLHGVPVSSLQFTPDGASLAVAKIGAQDTTVSVVSLRSSTVTPVTTIPGFATLIPQLP